MGEAKWLRGTRLISVCLFSVVSLWGPATKLLLNLDYSIKRVLTKLLDHFATKLWLIKNSLNEFRSRLHCSSNKVLFVKLKKIAQLLQKIGLLWPIGAKKAKRKSQSRPSSSNFTFCCNFNYKIHQIIVIDDAIL